MKRQKVSEGFESSAMQERRLERYEKVLGKELNSSSTESERSESTGSSAREESDAGDSESELDPRTKDIPLGQLLNEAPSGRIGYRLPKLKKPKIAEAEAAGSKSSLTDAPKRENKNRPSEMSSKRPAPKRRRVIEAPSRKSWDPRFEDGAGAYSDEAFKKRYAFVYDENLPEERSQTVKALKKSKSPARKKELQGNLTRIQQQIRGIKDERRRKDAEAASKAREREAVKQGKKPFFLKRSEQRRQELVRRFHDLKATGRLEKVMAKRRKKNAAKDHRYLPSGRRS